MSEPSRAGGQRSALLRAVGAPEALLVRARDSMTPGQRQTAALVMAVALAVVLVGLPHQTVTVPSAAPSGPRRAAAVTPPKALAAPVARAAAPIQTVAGPVLQASAGLDVEPPLRDLDVPAAPALPRIVALVRSGESPVPGRDDADIAAAFIGRSGFHATTVAYDPADATSCSRVLAAGDLVIAGRGIDEPVRQCLVSGGATIVAADSLGDSPAAAPGGGQVVSTRRGITDSLVDLGAWGLASGTLKGRVGVVSVKSAAPKVSAAVHRLQDLGVNVVAATYLADDTTAAPDIANAVLEFASKQVATVVFAAPVADQRVWVDDAALLSPGTRYVVSDTFDGVTTEAYSPNFDGALAHTSVRVPWFARSHGATPAQAACDTTWTQTATVPTTVPGDEALRVYQWCTNVGLVSSVMGAFDLRDPVAALRTQAAPSAFTSDLGPLAGGGFGPTQDAVLVWRASCACWQESTPFTTRP